ncbi:MAG: hypothetical protein AB8G22_21480, partial [Saprospiraceae bacterium]
IDVATNGVGVVLDTLKTKLAQPGTPLHESYQDIDKILKNLTITTNRMNRMLAASSGSIEGMLKNLESTTGTVEKNNAQIEKILSSTANFTGNLEKMELDKTLNETTETIKTLRSTLESSNKMIADLNQITAKVSEGDGSLAKLINDKELYNRLNAAINNADSLMTDLQEKPYRYMPLKSRKRVKKYDRQDGN